MNLPEMVMRLDNNKSYAIRWIYSSSIYSDILEGLPDIRYGEKALQTLKDLATTLTWKGLGLFVFEEHKVGTTILPLRGNVAFIDDAYRHGMVIWFDDGKSDAREMLGYIITVEGFEKITEEYSF